MTILPVALYLKLLPFSSDQSAAMKALLARRATIKVLLVF